MSKKSRTPVAPQMVTHTCGHRGRYHLYGMVGEQMVQVSKLEGRKCRKCSKA